ncbi:phosphoglycerate dehydrogenase [Propionimicrobium lymphophilum]|uniref:phosphoglycerate dehydrogenase n=1 Tax=Propionimicrobium lymphophilum TaxID=33012 RepID=UPI00288A667C|nr:phosphoglycerate dehydrogenase [Propionimicrobium lymphophilum]
MRVFLLESHVMKALLLENIDKTAVDAFEAAGFEVDYRKGALEGDELIQALQDVNVVGVRSRTNLTADVIEQMPEQLVAIGAFSIGTNQIALDAAAKRGIVCFNAPYSNTRSVVELAMGEIVVMARRLFDKSQQMHNGVWQKSADGSHEVRGRTLGIIGYGNIGSQLSILAESFGMNVNFYDVADKLALGNAHRCDSLEELLSISETVSIHVDGRNENHDIFGEKEFALMPERSLFLNLSRGFVVDEEALAENLRSGHIAGAAVDVYHNEPKKSGDPFTNPLQGIPNVILTPHVGGSTREAQSDIGGYVSGKLIDYVRTGNTSMSVNMPEVQVQPISGHRILHIHHNVPGVMADLNSILSNHNANIAYQALSTIGEVGFVVMDITASTPGLTEELAQVPHTIRVREVS